MNRFYKIFIFLTLFIGSSLVANAQDLSFKVGLSGTVTELDATGEELTGLDPQERNTRTETLFGAYASAFAELQVNILSIGISRSQDLESETTENKRGTNDSNGDQGTNKVQVDIQDIYTVYAKVDLDFLPVPTGNLYVKGGMITADLITNENLATGSSYGDTELEGYMGGVGYERDMPVGEGLFVRAELAHTQFDPISLVSTKKSATGAFNRIKLDTLEGQSLTLSVGKAF
tara:strand:- start:1363 stop:2058 length:696 start_codon:yes stop_codon:yes gene_type:complete